jgi:D-alanine-D-alanine ligase
MKKNKLRIGVIFGGRSGEHDVSLMSARFILDILKDTPHKIIPIGISREGSWFSGNGVLKAFQSGEFSELDHAAMLPDPARRGIWKISAEQISLLSGLDVAFPVLHGTYGEDGSLQGLFEMAEIAYVGAGVLGSAAAMDKALFFDVMRANSIPVVDTILISRSDIQDNIEAQISEVEKIGDYPLFVKPANLGSSVGISKVQNRSDLLEGLMEAAEYDRRMIVQQGLDVREIEVSLLGNEHPEASVCGEIIPGEEFYSYEAKYHDDKSFSTIPAEISAALSTEIREIAIKAYRALDLAGMARVDFFIEKETEKIYLNEINTIPGFTQISMYPMLWEGSGVSNTDLIERLISLAMERFNDKTATKRDFQRVNS